MYYELSKPQKKIARKVMDKGLFKDYRDSLEAAQKVIGDWNLGQYTDREAYMELYKQVTAHDKIIARRYNDKGGSRWVEIMADQLGNDVISLEDLAEFDEEVRDVIVRYSEFFR
jgi:hypothetical protein